MTLHSSNVLLFPPHAVAPPETAPPAQRDNQHATLMALSADERSDDAALIIRLVIGFAQRKGRGLESSPPQLRRWFLELCELGDPAGLMVRDWLDGNTQYTTRTAEETV